MFGGRLYETAVIKYFFYCICTYIYCVTSFFPTLVTSSHIHSLHCTVGEGSELPCRWVYDCTYLCKILLQMALMHIFLVSVW